VEDVVVTHIAKSVCVCRNLFVDFVWSQEAVI